MVTLLKLLTGCAEGFRSLLRFQEVLPYGEENYFRETMFSVCTDTCFGHSVVFF